MKRVSFFTLGLFFVIFLISCGGGSSSKNNKFFGKVPSMVKDYMTKMNEKEEKAESSTKMEEAFKFAKEAENLKKEMESKVEELVANSSLVGTEIPFQTLSDDSDYEVAKVILDNLSANYLKLKFTVQIKNDIKNEYGGIEKTLFIYFKAVDSKGVDIPQSKTVAVNFGRRTELKANTELEISGGWNGSDIAQMENFAKLIEITKEEYDKK